MFYPWEQNKKPNFINKEGFEWYYDKFATDFATKDIPLYGVSIRKGMNDVAAFYVRKDKQINCVLIDKNKNIVTEADTSIGLCEKINQIKIWEDFILHEVGSIENLIEKNLYLDEINNYNKKNNESVRIVKIYTDKRINKLYIDEAGNPIS